MESEESLLYDSKRVPSLALPHLPALALRRTRAQVDKDLEFGFAIFPFPPIFLASPVKLSA